MGMIDDTFAHTVTLIADIIEKIDNDDSISFIDMSDLEKESKVKTHLEKTTWAFDKRSTVEEIITHLRDRVEDIKFLQKKAI